MLDVRTVGAHLGRSRHESGWVEKTGKTIKKWRGYFHVYATLPDGTEKRLRRKVLLGTCAELTKGAAEDKLRDHIRESRGQRVATGPGATVAALCDEWFNMSKEDWSDANQKTVRTVFERLIKPAIGSMEVSKVQAPDLKALVNDLPKRQWKTPTGEIRTGVSHSYAQKVVTYLRCVFDYAVDQDMILKNPARSPVKAMGLKIPKAARKPVKKYLTFDDIQMLLAQLDAEDHLVVDVALECAMRPSEIFALKRNDVGDGFIRVDESLDQKGNAKEPKTESSKAKVSIGPRLKRELADWVETHPGNPDDLIFANRDGGPRNAKNELNRMLKPAAKRAGLGKVTFQMLRRTFATLARGTLKDIQTQMRHSKPDTTAAVYMQPIGADVQRMVNTFEQSIFGETASVQ
jgi:integrase